MIANVEAFHISSVLGVSIKRLTNRFFFVLKDHIFCDKVQTVEEQVRAAAEHKLGVANQSITAGFFDNNTRLIRIFV